MSEKMKGLCYLTPRQLGLLKLHVIPDHMHKNVFSQSKIKVLPQFGRTEGIL